MDIPHKAVELTDEEKAALAEPEPERRRAKKAEYNRLYMEKKRRQWKEQQGQGQAKQLSPAVEQHPRCVPQDRQQPGNGLYGV